MRETFIVMNMTLDQIEKTLFDTWRDLVVLGNPQRKALLSFPPKQCPTVSARDAADEAIDAVLDILRNRLPQIPIKRAPDTWTVEISLQSEVPARRFYLIKQMPDYRYDRTEREQGTIIVTEERIGRTEVFLRLNEPEPEVIAALARWKEKMAIEVRDQVENDRVKTDAKKTGKPRRADQLKATVVHYAVTVALSDQDRAADLVGTTSRTYRKYRDNKWLLLESEYMKDTGKSPETAWKEFSS